MTEDFFAYSSGLVPQRVRQLGLGCCSLLPQLGRTSTAIPSQLRQKFVTVSCPERSALVCPHGLVGNSAAGNKSGINKECQKTS